MALHVYDGDRFWLAVDLAEAQRFADESIAAHRDACDPEWPHSVEEVAVYEAPADAEDPDEGECLLIATQIDVRDDPTGQCDYHCDYAMKPPTKEPK